MASCAEWEEEEEEGGGYVGNGGDDDGGGDGNYYMDDDGVDGYYRSEFEDLGIVRDCGRRRRAAVMWAMASMMMMVEVMEITTWMVMVSMATVSHGQI